MLDNGVKLEYIRLKGVGYFLNLPLSDLFLFNGIGLDVKRVIYNIPFHVSVEGVFC